MNQFISSAVIRGTVEQKMQLVLNVISTIAGFTKFIFPGSPGVAAQFHRQW